MALLHDVLSSLAEFASTDSNWHSGFLLQVTPDETYTCGSLHHMSHLYQFSDCFRSGHSSQGILAL
jgi:hypothetical protein